MNRSDLQKIDKSYISFLEEVKKQVRNRQVRAARAANQELVKLYWWFGKNIVERQEQYGWGKSVVEQLSKDLRDSFAGSQGFSVRNLWSMRQFYLEYKDLDNLQQLVAEIPWGQNLIIMAKVKDSKAREYYLKSTRDMAWSRNILALQIESQAYERHVLMKKQNNFDKALPPHLAEQASEAMKDVYMLDMLGITKPVVEAEIESRMVNRIKDVLLELGYGFTFIGNQYRIHFNNKDYYIDLLLYNRRLNALIALELKSGQFKPEYAGKMNFYLNLLDDFVREKNENSSIGIILCSKRDRIDVEYALRGIEKPVGVSQYLLTKELPDNLKGKLPDAEQLEFEILKGLGADSDEANSESSN